MNFAYNSCIFFLAYLSISNKIMTIRVSSIHRYERNYWHLANDKALIQAYVNPADL